MVQHNSQKLKIINKINNLLIHKLQLYRFNGNDEGHVRSIMPLPQVRATVSLSWRSSFVGYSGNFKRLKLERKSTKYKVVQEREGCPF